MRPALLALAVACLLAPSAAGQGAAAAEPTTLAVLNFANRNPGDGWDWLQTGLADMLITDLSTSGRFLVVSREDMVSLMRTYDVSGSDEKGARAVARQAKAERAVGGYYTVADAALSIVAFVVDVTTGDVTRVEAVSGPKAEAFALEKRLALALIERFHVTLTPAERAQLDTVPTDDLDAAAHAYRGLALADRGRPFEALADLRRAARLDPHYGRAGALQAELYALMRETDHARVEFLRVGREAKDDRDRCMALVRAVELPGDTDEIVAVSRRVIEGWPRALGVNSYPPRAIVADRAARLLAEDGRIAEALHILDSGAVKPEDDFHQWGENLLLAARHYVLCMSGQVAQGAPEDCDRVLLITPEQTTRRVDGPRYRSWRTGSVSPNYFHHDVFVQAPRGHGLTALHVRASVQSPKAKDASISVFRPGSIAVRHVYGARATLAQVSSAGTGQPEELSVDVGLAPGTRSVRLHIRNGVGRMAWWEATGEIAPLGETGALAVECEPAAKLLIDGRPGGTTADTYLCVPAGEHTISADYTDVAETFLGGKKLAQLVTIEPGRTATVRFEPYGEAFARTWDERVRVEIGGGETGQNRRGIRLLPDGHGGMHVYADALVHPRSTAAGRVSSNVVYGHRSPGQASVVLRPLPPPMSGRYAQSPSLVAEPRGGYLMAYSQSRGKEPGTHLVRTWDFLE